MKLSPLQLKGSHYPKIHLDWVEASSISKGFQWKLESSYAISAESSRTWIVGLELTFQPTESKAGFNGDIRIEGNFEVLPEVPDERIERLVAVNAPSVLAGMLRETAIYLTRRSPGTAFVLPSVSFIDQEIFPSEGAEEVEKTVIIENSSTE